tara:strand:- start:593 stop:1186 length:594 start_codon:yes stop_codon:yes gene_type:complete
MYNPILWECNCHIDDKVVDDLMQQLYNDDIFNDKMKYYSSYYLDESIRPDNILFEENGVYYNIITQVLRDMGFAHRSDITVRHWMQLYDPNNTGDHTVHDHYSPLVLLSFIHFIRPTDTKCFYFEDSDGGKLYPKQDKGDFIVFPSWLQHGVDPNTYQERSTIVGNIVFNRLYDHTRKRNLLLAHEGDSSILVEKRI